MLSALLVSAVALTALPDGVLFKDAPATMKRMRAVAGEWATPDNLPAVTLSVVRPGWMSLKVGKGIRDWPGLTTSIPVAVTTHSEQWFINISFRFIYPAWGFEKSYRGKECYGTLAVVESGDAIKLADLDDEKMRAANRWYPEELPTWDGKQISCGDFVRRAEAALRQPVVVILDPKPWLGGPFHRIRAKVDTHPEPLNDQNDGRRRKDDLSPRTDP